MKSGADGSSKTASPGPGKAAADGKTNQALNPPTKGAKDFSHPWDNWNCTSFVSVILEGNGNILTQEVGCMEMVFMGVDWENPGRLKRSRD